MKKSNLFCAFLLALSFICKAQENLPSTGNPNFKSAASNTLLVKDTLHYYLNKYYFKTATTQLSNFPTFTSAAATVTNVTHCGSRFDVPAGETVTVTGLEAYAKRVPNGVLLFVPIHIMLCHLDAAGMPILPPIDSVEVKVTGDDVLTKIGGDLHSARTMTTDFAILFRNMSTNSGDYARLMRTAGSTQTNVAADPATKCSDTENGKDYGFVRFDTVFYSTRDFTLAPGFGIGTQYEFVVAPRVEYNVQASQITPTFVVTQNDTLTVPDTLCTRTEMVFTNTSSKFFEHRMYNLNQFYRKWNLYSAFPTSVANAFESDSSITWHFDFYDIPSKPDSRVFLPYVNNHTISAITDLSYYPDCFDANEFRARLKPMGALGKVPQLVFNQVFKVCFNYCNGDTVGINAVEKGDGLIIYPNPTGNGKVFVSGLSGKNTLFVYNLLGQLIQKEYSESSLIQIDLLKQPSGTYLIKIISESGQTRILKTLKE
jgi:hypothetical protein